MKETNSSVEESWLENFHYLVHELKTPIVVTKGFVDLVQNVGPLNESQIKYVNRAMESLERMQRLVLQLLQAAWIDFGKPLLMGEVNLQNLVEREVSQLETFARDYKVHLHVDSMSLQVGAFYGDPERLGQVVSNLISNGIKYTKVGGGDVWISAESSPDFVRLTVRDNGVGMSEEHLSRIFERFYRISDVDKRIEGTGLGLYIVDILVQMHGGNIKCSSVLGEGTTFIVEIPRQPLLPAENKGTEAQEFPVV